MRQDKLTSQFQQALAEGPEPRGDARQPHIEPVHVLAAMPRAGRHPRALTERRRAHRGAADGDRDGPERSAAGAGRRAGGRRARPGLAAAGGRAQASKRGDQYVASEMFLLAGRRQDRPGRVARGTA